MIIGLGSDICNIKRIEQAYAKFGERFLQRCFGKQEQQELELLRDRPQRFAASLAKRFAAKEGYGNRFCSRRGVVGNRNCPSCERTADVSYFGEG